MTERSPSTYEPMPLDTEGVELDSQVASLRELLAKNAHDHWALQRIADGWQHGPQRNDDRKEHPCLVPYESLPDTEKEYDRRIATETLKAIVSLGYVIEKQ